MNVILYASKTLPPQVAIQLPWLLNQHIKKGDILIFKNPISNPFLQNVKVWCDSNGISYHIIQYGSFPDFLPQNELPTNPLGSSQPGVSIQGSMTQDQNSILPSNTNGTQIGSGPNQFSGNQISKGIVLWNGRSPGTLSDMEGLKQRGIEYVSYVFPMQGI